MKRILVLALALSGCSLYWGGDDNNNDDDCKYDGGGAPIASPSYRDPTTGVCQSFNEYPCDCPCGQACECPAYDVAIPDWGQCYTQCDALPEDQCLTTPGCHAAYDDESREALGSDGDAWTYATVFMGCWATPFNSTQHASSCANLDAQSCSQYDNCSMVYSDSYYGSTTFEQCIDETSTQPTDPGSCGGQILCNSAPPSCPANTTPGIANGCWTGYCIPNADCGTHDPGDCYGTVTCNVTAPSCPSGTKPGVVNGCYSGYCIPDAACEKLACEALPDEASCIGRSDCEAVYTGTNCTCDANGCTCQSETYARCETATMVAF